MDPYSGRHTTSTVVCIAYCNETFVNDSVFEGIAYTRFGIKFITSFLELSHCKTAVLSVHMKTLYTYTARV